MTVYTDKINEFIKQLEDEVKELNSDIGRLKAKRKVYEKILVDLRELKSFD